MRAKIASRVRRRRVSLLSTVSPASALALTNALSPDSAIHPTSAGMRKPPSLSHTCAISTDSRASNARPSAIIA